MAKVALLIGVSQYESGLSALSSAKLDVAAVQQVLANPEIGEFEIRELLDPDRQAMEEAIEALFSNCSKADLTLLFFSGHGVKDEQGRLYFTNCKTRVDDRKKLVRATATPASFVHELIRGSQARRRVVILDCCFSGAFAKGMSMKAGAPEDISVDIREQLGAEGSAILTSSTALEYSLEALLDESSTGATGQPDSKPSVYTRYLVEGLTTGAADADGDGMISVDELHEYVRGKVRAAAPSMSPEIYAMQEGYKIQLARAPIGDPRLIYRKEVAQFVRDGGRISVVARKLLNRRRNELQLSPEAAKQIEDEILAPYREYQQNLQEYEEVLAEVMQHENPLSAVTLEELVLLQKALNLRAEDIEPIHTVLGVVDSNVTPVVLPSAEPLNDKPKPTVKPPKPEQPVFQFEIVTVDETGKEKERRTGQAEYFAEDLGEGVTLEMVAIPGGNFLMGSPDGTGDADERPQHQVTIQPFYLGRYPITQAQWKAVAQLPKVKQDLGPDPAHFKGAKHPVECISWNDAIEFCARLAQKTGKAYRLPSEAEWEYACRAGTQTPFHFGETITGTLANYDATKAYQAGPKGEYRQQTTDVDSFPANAFGLSDMHGNVWEWCADHWHENYQGAPTDGSAWLSDSNTRLLRGGSWLIIPWSCRSANRSRNHRDYRNYSIGFRVALSPARTS